MAGYVYRGMRYELKEAQIITKEVIKYVEKEGKIRNRYKAIDTKLKTSKENILSGRVSEHYGMR